MLYLKMKTIYEFTHATPESRSMIEGEKNINSGMILLCGADSRCTEKIELYALHLQSAITLDPHTITGSLIIEKTTYNESEIEYDVSVQKMLCSCVAGASQECKHIVAVLLYCNRNDLNNLELISSTEKQCLWKKHKLPVLEQFQAQPTKTFCCIKQNRMPDFSIEEQENIRNRLIECNEKTALAKHRNRNTIAASIISTPANPPTKNRSSRTPFKEIHNIQQITTATVVQPRQDFTQSVIDNAMHSNELDFLKSINNNLLDCCKNIYNSKILCKDALQTATSTKHCKAKWLKERQFRITGSRCYTLYTYSKDDWPEKARKYFWAKEIHSKYLRHGNEYEGAAREKYAAQKKVLVQECGLIVAMSEPWLAYSPDGVVIENSQACRLLEIKCPYELENTSTEVLKKKCKFLKVEGNQVTVREKHQYYAQVQCGMALLNLKSCDFVVYSNVSNNIKIINISYDREYVQKLFSKLKKIYFEQMIHEICNNLRLS